MSRPKIEIVLARHVEAASLAEFFRDLQAAGDEEYFHPHPLTAEHAGWVVAYRGEDLYCAVLEGGVIVAYGMLRGWDEGYEIPSVAVAVHPQHRRSGHARLLMDFLEAAAKRRAAPKIRLKVYPHNKSAHRLYVALGYKFAGEESGQLVGLKSLK